MSEWCPSAAQTISAARRRVQPHPAPGGSLLTRRISDRKGVPFGAKKSSYPGAFKGGPSVDHQALDAVRPSPYLTLGLIDEISQQVTNNVAILDRELNTCFWMGGQITQTAQRVQVNELL